MLTNEDVVGRGIAAAALFSLFSFGASMPSPQILLHGFLVCPRLPANASSSA